ncbi:MAG: HAMP domain-containing protein [Pseudomonadales bacterium]|nr:HAMP domain-containing protein [Pseudomonadales bacterium]
MNNIFFRIYGGMLASLVLVGLLSFITLEFVYNNRNDAYREAMSKGTLRIVAETIARHEVADRGRWVERLNKLMGSELKLIDPDSISLSSSEKFTLEAGLVVLKTAVASKDTTVIFYVPDGKKNQLMSVAFEKVTEQQARGSATLVLDELERYPRTEWDQQLMRLEGYFGFPVRQVRALELNLDSAQFNRLQRGETILVLDDAMSANSVLRVVAPIPKSQNYLMLGPLALFDWFPYYLMILDGAIAFCLVGLAAYLLVRPLQKRLKNMENAVTQIRRGDLSARVTVNSHDALGQLGATLNDMAEHIQRLIRSRREMTHAVSHELRTPVARIRFGLEMIESAMNDEQRRKQIEDIDTDIEELNTLIDEILTYATLEEGRPALNFQMIDVDAVIKQVKTEMQALGTDIEIEHVEFEFDDGRRMAECEERYIHRVIQNLVGNAVRYAKSKVRVSCNCEGGMYRIDVDDDGPGIPSKYWDKVFVPFVRLDDSRTRSSGGYGLGLSIVERIAYWHGGVASIYKSDLGGAKFTIIWPRRQSLRKIVNDTLPESKLSA